MFMLLVIITVTASQHPLETLDLTTLSPDDPNSIIFTLPTPSSANSNFSRVPQAPIKSKADENRLEITLNLDESDKEIIDNDMGKYLKRGKKKENANLQKGLCRSVSRLSSFVRWQSLNRRKTLFAR